MSTTEKSHTWAWILSISGVVIVAVLATVVYFQFFFSYAEGVDTGELNYFSRQGIVFKTYEGKIIQNGLKQNTAGAQSNEFRFSVDDENVADLLMHSTGKQVELHYQRYFHPLWWRGESVYVVDSIWSVK